ncbi:MAG TPA: DUF4184 family protein [Ohtaekwangia sp.]|nr:DUF4184 family protein [Ohtaekwangia sp.]
MPFTPAHAAIVLPLIRRARFSATGLIVGSLAPDFEYFFKMSVSGIHGHTLPGLLYFDLPVTIVLSFVFHQVVKKNLILNLPAFLQRRFNDTLQVDFRSYFRSHLAVFVCSALLGSASHIFWDNFTHASGFFVQRLPVYDSTVIPFDGVNYPLFYALQHLSTAIGLLILLAYIALKPPTFVAVSRPRIVYWLALALVTASVMALRFTIRSSDINIGNQVVVLISGLCLALIITGFLNFRNTTDS